MNIPATRRDLIGGCALTGLGSLQIGLALARDAVDILDVVFGSGLLLIGVLQFWAGLRRLTHLPAPRTTTSQSAPPHGPAI
jgi:hypothetical protein